MFQLKVRFLISLIFFLSIIFVSPAAYSQESAPFLLPFQGRLTDSTGTPIPDGMRSILFKIYDQPSGGRAAWTGELHRTSVNGGLVNVLLGSKVQFGDDFDFNRQLYLEITVDIDDNNEINEADPPMLPRQVIIPVPFAAKAKQALLAEVAETVRGPDIYVDSGTGNVGVGKNDPQERLDVSGDVKATAFFGDGSGLTGIETIPPGVIVMWSGTSSSIPDGWALCDGTNGTPDLQDRFIVAAGRAYSVGTAGGSGSHSHKAGSYSAGAHSHTGSTGGPSSTKGTDTVSGANAATSEHIHSVSIVDSRDLSISGTSDESTVLPPYYALSFIMKL